MPMQLYFKRAKSFVHQTDEGGTKQFLAQPGPSPQPVPFWVAETPTFKQGVKDGSIVNLTPPEQMPGYKPAAAEVVEEAQANTTAELSSESDVDNTEQKEVPQAPFGGQPMTPVPPAVKVGTVRASGRGAENRGR